MPRVLLLLMVTVLGGSHVFAVEIHVSPRGDDAAHGTRQRPLRTLHAAVAQLKSRRPGHAASVGSTIYLHGGTYQVEMPVVLDPWVCPDSVTPLEIRPLDDATVIVSGGQHLPPEAFAPIDSAQAPQELADAALQHGIVCDLRSHGITDYGTIKYLGTYNMTLPAPMELFFNGEPMVLARYPNDGWLVVEQPAPDNNSFAYSDPRVSMWHAAEQVWLFGYWAYHWGDELVRVDQIDRTQQRIFLQPLNGPRFFPLTEGQKYYAVNILHELDSPGEWFLDREGGKLYFWPPAPMEDAEIVVSMLESPFLVMKNVNRVSVRGIDFAYARGSGIQIVGGEGNRIQGCTLRNLGNVGIVFGEGTFARSDPWEGAAREVVGQLKVRQYDDTNWNRHAGVSNGVQHCRIFNTGEGGIILGGGDRVTLTPGGNYVRDCDIHDFNRRGKTYKPGVLIDGVGNIVEHNHIHHAPHAGIMFLGNDHLIQLNELDHLCRETGDVGVIYTGRDFTQRGTRIRQNYIHDIAGFGGPGAFGIYLDDTASGIEVVGNVIFQAEAGVLVGGGRENVIRDNLIVQCAQSIQYDSRGYDREWYASATVYPQGIMFRRLVAAPLQSAVWRARYPELYAMLHDEDPFEPRNSVIDRNVIILSPEPQVSEPVRRLSYVGRNPVLQSRTGTERLNQGEIKLQENQELHTIFPSFPAPPIALMGKRDAP